MPSAEVWKLSERTGSGSRGGSVASSALRHQKKPALTKGRAFLCSRIAQRLGEIYPEAHCELHHDTPFQLLVATILSAQCTDHRVNLVTPRLFAQFSEASGLAEADVGEVEGLIFSTGFYRNKARNLIACAQVLVQRHGGEVPRTMASLVALPGVGRKTANVILGTAFGIGEGIVVDTHVKRVARRLGLTCAHDPEKIERDLMGKIARQDWIRLSHWLIWHGRRRCGARRPDCAGCELNDLCPRVIERRCGGGVNPG